jgi:phosphate-selective porin OprO and OprP
MRRRQRLVVLIAAMGATTAIGVRLYADDTNTVPSAPPASGIDQKIEQLDQEIQELKRQRELDQQQAQQQTEEATRKALQTPVVTAGEDGFALKSADDNFVLRLRGYAQADGRFYLDNKANYGTDTFLMRRVRPILEGTVYRDFDFRIMPDFGNGASSTTLLQDAWVEWHYWPWLKVRAGKYKPPVGLEQLQQDTWTFFAERGLPSDLVPQRDVGVQVSGDLFGGVVTYAAGVFNGVVDNSIADLATWDAKDGDARIFVLPFKTTDIDPLKGLGFGVGGTIGDRQPSSATTNLPTYKTTGQDAFFTYNDKGAAPDGLEYRVTPQGYYYWGPLGLLGEYAVADEQMRNGGLREYVYNTAWQVEGSFVLTGENASYNGVIPRHPFDPKVRGLGALEVVARYGQLDVDHDAFNVSPTDTRLADPTKEAQGAKEWGIGLNWYLNKDIKFVLDYEQTHFRGGAGATTGTGSKATYLIADREAEEVVIGRVQLAF